MYGLYVTPSWDFEPRNPLIFLVCFKVYMLFFIWTKFEENLSTGFVSIYLTQTSLNNPLLDFVKVMPKVFN